RPAPVQVNYLGYPGTMGAGFIDYVIADRITIPFDRQPFYAEQIVHLPECFQVNDSRMREAQEAPNRDQLGLPDTGFVFCCFNSNYKLTPAVFDVWSRILRRVDGSVLWLFGGSESAVRNLRHEIEIRKIPSSRVIFAQSVPFDRHL